MNRLLLLVVCLGGMIQVCGAIPAAPTRVMAPFGTATSAPSRDAPADISLLVGHAVDGGWYQLYFSDPANSASDQSTGGPDNALVGAIDAAMLSVDVAIYNFSLKDVVQALLRAQRRGVQVRIVMESDNMDGSAVQTLKDGGIPILGDRHESLMHNKFLVVDGSEVWTGSMNLTSASAYSDRNNLMRIRSPQLAQDYEAEFNEMFVDDKFSGDAGKPTPYPTVTVDGTRLDVYFSPDDHPQAALVSLLNNAQSSIRFMAYSFTADPLGEAIRARAKAGIRVSGVMDADQMRNNIGTEYDAFRAAGLDVRLDGEPGLLHDKVMIVDEKVVVFGSYNFTASAEKYNDENIIVVHNPAIAAQYLQEFQRVYSAAQP
jgi:phosphatidylserine/phosphatidylglycerophosphate/cardiolipin synthase-like enzyme